MLRMQRAAFGGRGREVGTSTLFMMPRAGVDIEVDVKVLSGQKVGVSGKELREVVGDSENR